MLNIRFKGRDSSSAPSPFGSVRPDIIFRQGPSGGMSDANKNPDAADFTPPQNGGPPSRNGNSSGNVIIGPGRGESKIPKQLKEALDRAKSELFKVPATNLIKVIAGLVTLADANLTGMIEPITTDPSIFTKFNVPPLIETIGFFAVGYVASDWVIKIITNPFHPKIIQQASSSDPRLAGAAKDYMAKNKPSRTQRVVAGLAVATIAITGIKYFGPKIVPPDSHIARGMHRLDIATSKSADFLVRIVGGKPAVKLQKPNMLSHGAYKYHSAGPKDKPSLYHDPMGSDFASFVRADHPYCVQYGGEGANFAGRGMLQIEHQGSKGVDSLYTANTANWVPDHDPKDEANCAAVFDKMAEGARSNLTVRQQRILLGLERK